MHNATADTTAELPADLAAELEAFEAEERKRLGLPPRTQEGDERTHWFDPVPSKFTRQQRETTTLMVCGLTMAHDLFVQSGLRGVGYKVEALEVPDNDALQYGREFGNRGQCNPTYFTVGNLIKSLERLRQGGMSTEEIVEKYIFLTAGACGPCRFGTYVTEFRKALRDSGFDGFRVLLFEQTGGLKQAMGEGLGLELNPTFFWALVKGIIAGDILNALMYRIRPYEVEQGATDAAMARSKAIVAEALEQRTNILKALRKCKQEFAAVEVDRTRVCPKVAIIGEFWAMTTEGDGNYELQKFLESEGAEVDIQLVTAWLLYNIWCVEYDTRDRAKLRGIDGGKFGLTGIDVRKRMLTMSVARKLVLTLFHTFARAAGLEDYHLPNMNDMAEVSHAFYDNNLRGGEGHMEVGKVIQNVIHNKVTMTLSVKPFGCMPSSSVSDGVQSLITELHPEAIFLPIETNGDGKVNVYSRIQMQLFKAKQVANKEVQNALIENSLTLDEVREHVAKRARLASSLHKPPHQAGTTTADLIYEVGAKKRGALGRLRDRLTKARKPKRSIQAAAVAAAERLKQPAQPKPDQAAPQPGKKKLPIA